MITKNSPFNFHFSSNKTIIKNAFILNEINNNFKIRENVNFIKINKKNFSRKLDRNIFESFSLDNQNMNNNNIINNKYNYENKLKNSKEKINNKDSEKLENNFENDKNSEDLEKKFDNLFSKVVKSEFDYTKSLQLNSKSEAKLNNSENYSINKLEEFKKYIQSTLYIPKTDFNDRLNIKETELNHINKITEDYYIDQLGIFKNPKRLKLENDFINKTDSVEKEFEIYNNKDFKNKLWITHDIPTSATGKPHFTQIMNKVIKDAINRIKNLQGYRIIYKIGFECYGINMENYIFKKMNKKKFKTLQELLDHKFNELTNQVNQDELRESDEIQSINYDRSKALFFREQCREFIEEYILEQKEYFKRMGIMAYYNHTYSTFERKYENKQLDFFQDLYERGLIFRDFRKICWSENSQKILGVDEVEEKTELNDALVIKFPVIELSNDLKQIQTLFPNKNFFFLGFLTEAYKYIGVQALSINDNADYCIAELSEESKELVICAYKRLPEICKRANFLKTFKVHFIAKGWAFKNLIAQDPIFSRKLPIISNDNVNIYNGTGINLICPAHELYKNEDENSFARKYKLSLQGYIDENNNFCKSLGFYFYNTNCFSNGNKKIISKLNSLKSLFLSFKYENIYYTSKKTGERITSRTIPSWFLKIDDNLKNQGLKELSLVKYHPELNFQELKEKNDIKKKIENQKLKYMPRKKRQAESSTDLKDYFNVIEELDNIDEWCISDVNTWGLPIPCFVNVETKQILMDSEILNHIKELFYENGSDIWFSWEVKDLLPEKYKKVAHKYITGRENFDQLFDNALSWFNIENFSNEEREVLENFEKFRNFDYIRELNKEFNKIKLSIDEKNKLKEEDYESTESNKIENEKDYEVIKNNKIQNNVSDSENSGISSFEKELFKSENLSLNLKEKRIKGKTSESEKEYTDFSTGSRYESQRFNKLDKVKSNLKRPIFKEDVEIQNENLNNDKEEFSNKNEILYKNVIENDLLYENIAKNPNFEKIKEIIPEPILLEHLSKKSKNIVSIQDSFIKNNRNPYVCIYDIIIEGKNQHSLWLLFSCLTSISHHNFNIYKSVLTHGYILDSSGKEISEKNFKDALDIVDGTIKRTFEREYGNGADSLRLYFLKHSFDLDYKLFEEDILKAKANIKLYRKLAKICLSLLQDYDMNKIENNLIQKIKVSLDELEVIDQIFIFEFYKYYEEANESIKNYNISELVKKTFDFLKNVLDVYFMDSSKYVIINYKTNDFRRLIKQFLIKEVLINITKILYPIIPFNTEDVYSHMYFLRDKKQYLGFEEFTDQNELKTKLNFNMTEYQRVNYEFKSKNVLQIKNKFLYLFNAIVDKANMKNKLKESEYINHYNEDDYGNFNPIESENENFNIKDLRQVEKKVKSIEDSKKNKLKINLIENDFHLSNQNDLILYKNDLIGSDMGFSNIMNKE